LSGSIRSRHSDEWKADARRKVAEGLAELKAGQVVDSPQAVAEIMESLRNGSYRPRTG